MFGREIANRHAQWERFRAWEAGWRKGAAELDSEETVRTMGEIVEFYLEVSGNLPLAGRSIMEKAEAIRRLQHSLRFVARVR